MFAKFRCLFVFCVCLFYLAAYAFEAMCAILPAVFFLQIHNHRCSLFNRWENKWEKYLSWKHKIDLRCLRCLVTLILETMTGWQITNLTLIFIISLYLLKTISHHYHFQICWENLFDTNLPWQTFFRFIFQSSVSTMGFPTKTSCK